MTRSTDHRGLVRIAIGALVVLLGVGVLVAPAAVAQTDAGTFEIEIADAPGEANVGDEITVEATVENTGESAANGTVSLEVNGSEVDTAGTGSIDPGETATVELTDTVEGDLPDETEFTVAIGDTEAIGSFTVNRGSQFGIEITDAPSDPVSAGETVELTAEIENAGGSGETTVSLENGDGTVESRSVELGGGESTEETFSYSTTERDLGTVDLTVDLADGSDASRSFTVGLPDGEPFAAARTSPNDITVTLADSAVGPNGSVPNGELTLRSDPGSVQWSWNVSASTPENGLYQDQLSVPRAGGVDDASLVGATVEIGESDLSDGADLHTVESASFDAWTEDGTLYLPVDTVGVTNTSATDVSLVLSGGTVAGSLIDSQTVAVDLGTFRETVAPDRTAASRFETDGAPVGSAAGTDPEIRYLHGEIVLWHPHVQDGAEHTVTLHSIDGEEIEASINTTADRPGAIPVPNGGAVAGAESVTISVSGVVDTREIAGPEAGSQSLNATLLDGGTIEADRNLERLSISSVLIDAGSEPTYLAADDISIDGGQLRLSGITLGEAGDEVAVRLATDAGIVAVQLSPPEGASTFYTALLVLALLVGAIVTIAGGALTGRWIGLRDALEWGILVVVLLGSVGALLIGLLNALELISFSVPFEPWGLIAAGVVAMFGTGYGVGGTLLYPTTEERDSPPTPTETRRVSVTDGAQPIEDEVEIEAVRGRGANVDRRTSTVRGGATTIELPRKTWKLTATLETGNHAYTSDPVQVDFGRRGGPIELGIELPGVTVAVRDETRDFPIPDASVRMEANGTTETRPTDDDGRVRFDPPPEAETVTIVADHEKYEEGTTERQLPKTGFNERIGLRQRPGELRVRSRIDGVDTGGMDIEITPDEPALKRIYKEGATIERTTDESGEYVNDELLVGQYRVSLAPPERLEHLFETTDKRAVVEKPAETVTLEASFTWDLSASQRDRIDRIREDLRDVTKSGADVAIPRYYVSVVEDVLEAVESFPEGGHHFTEIDADPDTVADATLDAAAEATETISKAMSTKRNLDLFTACSDMADADVRWTGSFEMETLIERLTGDRMAARRAFAARADEVSERIDAERGSLSEIAPAREMLQRVNIDGSEGGVDGVVSIHVSLLLLDAIEELFEHRELTERLSRTVF